VGLRLEHRRGLRVNFLSVHRHPTRLFVSQVLHYGNLVKSLREVSLQELAAGLGAALFARGNGGAWRGLGIGNVSVAVAEDLIGDLGVL
jgi:hypothetical protein